MLCSNLWNEYQKERIGAETIYLDTRGFCSYIVDGKEFFIEDFFLSKSARGSKAIRDLVKLWEKEAAKHECQFATAKIYLDANGTEAVLRLALKLGFKIYLAKDNVIGIVKEL